MKFTGILLTFVFWLTFNNRENDSGTTGEASASVKEHLASPGTFSYTIHRACRASAGVYKNDSILVRTLWNNIQYAPGKYTGTWDGKDDMGNPVVSEPTFKIKILTNNVKYTWQGTVGNTSDSMTGASKHRGYYHCMMGLAFGPSYGYFCTGYSEGSPSVGKFLISKPQQKINPYYTQNSSTAYFDYVATDGVKVYWGGFDASSASSSFVTGNYVNNDAPVIFSNGVEYKPVYQKAINSISYVNHANALISGLAVQKRGNYLFVARGGINQLQVVNKSTGELIQTIAYPNPKGLSIDAQDNLWMITGINTVAKYTVSVNGTITGPKLSLQGLIKPVATQVASDGTEVSIADDSTSQQVKFFSNTTGVAINTLGAAGGYLYDATVNNNKFYWSDINGSGLYQYDKKPFIAYQPDGTFWVNDGGNFRVQHYTRGRTFIDRIMSLGATYAVYVDKNNISKVYSGFMEFKIDYSTQRLRGIKGWTLTRNWGAKVSNVTYNSLQYTPLYTLTLNNGRTYAFLRRKSSYEVIEFASNKQIRFTGIMLASSNILCSDGGLQDFTLYGSIATFKRYPLIGFDSSGNPQWSSTAEILAIATTNNTTGNCVVLPKSQIFSNTGKIVLFNYKAHAANTNPPTYASGYHLGLMQRGAKNVYLFQTEKSTHRNYLGPYPNAGWFDVGNVVNDFAGGCVNILGRNIITSYHGEGWKNTQTNKYNHYYDNGLAIGQFGITRPESGQRPAAGMAGNALTPTLVKDNHGDLYLWHGDESDHAGIHRWKITDLNTISEQEVPIIFSSEKAIKSAPPAEIFIDLVAGIPFNGILLNNTAGWSRYPTEESNLHPYNNHWRVNTSVLKYEGSPDIFINFAQPEPVTYYVNRNLGTDKITRGWKITGNVNFGTMLNGYSNNAFMEVLDNRGKIITTLYATIAGNNVYGNEIAVAGASKHTEAFEISVMEGTASFSYAGSKAIKTTVADRTADWTRPATFKLQFISKIGLPNYNLRYDVSDLKFYKN
ncbi:MAG: Ig family protein [Ferruginibacter sp.]|nr:Ig family protein [Ferruginibacter sp.]